MIHAARQLGPQLPHICRGAAQLWSCQDRRSQAHPSHVTGAAVTPRRCPGRPTGERRGQERAPLPPNRTLFPFFNLPQKGGNSTEVFHARPRTCAPTVPAFSSSLAHSHVDPLTDICRQLSKTCNVIYTVISVFTNKKKAWRESMLTSFMSVTFPAMSGFLGWLNQISQQLVFSGGAGPALARGDRFSKLVKYSQALQHSSVSHTTRSLFTAEQPVTLSGPFSPARLHLSLHGNSPRQTDFIARL